MWDLEDLEGIVRCILWPEQFAEHGQHVQGDAILAMKAVVDRRPGAEGVISIVDELIPLADLSARFSSGVVIRVREDTHGPDSLEKLREIVRGYPGAEAAQAAARIGRRRQRRARLRDKSGVTLDPELRRRVEDLLGADATRWLVRAIRVAGRDKRPPSSDGEKLAVTATGAAGNAYVSSGHCDLIAVSVRQRTPKTCLFVLRPSRWGGGTQTVCARAFSGDFIRRLTPCAARACAGTLYHHDSQIVVRAIRVAAAHGVA